MPLIYYHFIVITILIAVAIIAKFAFKKKPKPSATALMTIGDYYNYVHRKIQAADTFELLIEVRTLVDGFYNKQYSQKADICMRRALRKSLLETFARRLNSLRKAVQ
jgi:hypothetical protein